MFFFSNIKSLFIKKGILSIILFVLLLVPKQASAKLVYLYDYSATVPGGTPTHISSDPDGVLYTYSPVGGGVPANPKYITRFPNRSTAETITWSQLDSNDYTDMVVTRNIIFAVNSSQWVTRISLSDLTGSVSTGCRTTSGGSSIFMSPSGNLYVARGSTWFGQINPNTLPPSLIVSFNSGLAINFAGLSPVPATKGCAVGSNGVVYYLRTSPRNSVSFRAITGTQTSSSFTLPGSWGSSPLGGKLIRVSPGGALYIPTALLSSVYTILKLLPVANGLTASFIASYNVNTGTSGNISTLVSMALLPNGQVAVLTSAGHIQLYAPLPSVSNVSVTPTTNGVYLSWVSNITDTDFSGATIRRSQTGFPTSATDGELVTANFNANTLLDTTLTTSYTTYYYRLFNRTVDGYYDNGVTVSYTTGDLTPPASVTGLSASISGTSIILNWTNPVASDFYTNKVLKKTGGFASSVTDATATVLTLSSLASTTVTDSSPGDGTYYYSVYSRDTSGNYSIVATTSITFAATPPEAPVITAVKTALNGSQINLSWNVPSDTSRFLLKQSFNSADATIVSANIPTSITSLSRLGLADGIYVYTLYAISSAGLTSNVGTSSTLTIDTTAPLSPEIEAVKPVLNGTQINLSWNAPTGTSKFVLRRSINSGAQTVVSGNVSSTTLALNQTGLAEGTYQYFISAVDAYGNTSTTANTTSLTIHTTAPATPTITAEKPTLNGNTINLSWTVPDTTHHLVLKQNTTVISSNVSVSRTTLSIPNLDDGDYAYTLYAVDAYQNTSNAGISDTVRIDTTPPSKPTAFLASASGSTISLSWTNPSVDFASVVIRVGSSSYPTSVSEGLLVTANSTATSLSQRDKVDGTYYYSLFANDTFGNISGKVTASVVVDTTAPSAPVVTLTKLALNSATVNVTWTRPTGTETFNYRDKVGSSETGLDGIWATQNAYLNAPFSEGIHTVSVVAIDAYGNKSATGSAEVVIDITAPSRPVITATKPRLNGDTISLEWTQPATTSKFLLKRKLNSEAATVVSANMSSTTTSFSQSALSDGTYEYLLYAVDDYTNTSNVGTSSTLTIDTNAPSAPDISATKPALNSRTINLSWDTPSGVAKFVLKRRYNSETAIVVSSNMSSSKTSLSQTGLDNGTYTYLLYAVDAYANTSNVGTSTMLTIKANQPDAPTLTATKPTLTGKTIDLTWTVPSGTSKFILKQSYNGGIATVVSSNIPSTVTSLSQTQLSDGTYLYTLYGVDDYANTSNAGTATQLTCDSAPPSKPGSFAITSEETTASLSWTKSSDTTSVTLRKSTTEFPTSITAGTAVLTDSDATSHTATSLEEGTYYFAIFAKDAYGNISSASTASILIDTKPSIEKLITRGEIEKGEIRITTNITTPIVGAKIGKNAKQATLNIAATYSTNGTKLGVGSGSVGHVVIASANGVWRDIGDVNVGFSGGQGVVKQTAGSVAISGKLQISSGSLYSLSGGTLKTTTFEIAANEGTDAFTWTGGTMEAQGVVGNLNNNGGTLVVKSDTPILITGNYTQGSTGQLAITLKAINVGLAHSTDALSNTSALIQTTQGISLSGTIKVALDGYIALPGDKILIVNRPVSSLRLNALHPQSEAVTFDLPDLESRLSWDTTSFETDGYIGIVGSSSGLLVDRPLNYPNPFKLSTGTDIGYYLNEDADIDLRVYTASGSEVYRVMLVSGVDNGAKAGYNKVHIGRENLDKDLPSGVYPYMLIHTGKVIGQGRLVVRPN